ncbi:MAG: hypothetical protein QM679_12330 [Patulibacter sp.]
MQRLLILAATLLLTLPPLAGATAAGGRADLKLGGKTTKILKRAHVKVRVSGGGTATKTKVMLPITSSSTSAITFAGTLKFGSGKRAVLLKQLSLDRAQGLLYASVNGTRVPFFLVEMGTLKQRSDGLDQVLSSIKIKFSALGASVMASHAKLKVGTGTIFAAATFTLQEAAVRLAAGATLTAGGAVQVATQLPAQTGSAWQLPVTNAGGKVSLTAPITLSGGLQFTGATGTLTFTGFTLDPVAGVWYAEQSPSGRLPLFTVDRTAAKSVKRGAQLIVSGLALSLTAEAAAALNAALGTTAYSAGTAAGTATIVGLR